MLQIWIVLNLTTVWIYDRVMDVRGITDSRATRRRWSLAAWLLSWLAMWRMIPGTASFRLMDVFFARVLVWTGDVDYIDRMLLLGDGLPHIHGSLIQRRTWLTTTGATFSVAIGLRLSSDFCLWNERLRLSSSFSSWWESLWRSTTFFIAVSGVWVSVLHLTGSCSSLVKHSLGTLIVSCEPLLLLGMFIVIPRCIRCILLIRGCKRLLLVVGIRSCASESRSSSTLALLALFFVARDISTPIDFWFRSFFCFRLVQVVGWWCPLNIYDRFVFLSLIAIISFKFLIVFHLSFN